MRLSSRNDSSSYAVTKKLTSSDAKQYQQNTCLQRLHIICAQPESRSMGTWHIGQRFTSESSVLLNGILKHNISSLILTNIKQI